MLLLPLLRFLIHWGRFLYRYLLVVVYLLLLLHVYVPRVF